MKRREKTACLAAILAAHLALPLLFGGGEAPKDLSPAVPPEPIFVSLRPPPPPPPVPSQTPTAQSSDGGAAAPEVEVPEPAAAAPAPPVRVRPARPTTRVEPLPIAPTQTPTPVRNPTPAPDPAPTVAPMPVIGSGQLAGALRAGDGGSGSGGSGDGSGGGTGSGAGGSCDMIARLQRALRDDDDIRAAIAAVPNSASGAVLVWNGDWIQSPGQAGRGLATVRQAIAVEVAFAPPICRAGTVSGLALISLGDGTGAPKLVLGKGSWRWSDLVSTRR